MEFFPYLSKSRQAMIVGGLLGAMAFLLIYGVVPLNPAKDTWLLNGFAEIDTIQEYAGWMLFRASPWSWPLGIGSNLNYPSGACVCFTGNVTLFAIFFKALSPLLGETFQYVGLYNLLSFVLQGVSAGLLLSLFIDKLLYLHIGTLLFVFAPIMIERAFRHSPLGSQWLILFSLFLYFNNRRSQHKRQWQFGILACLAAVIHPYFVPMVLAILFADLVDQIIQTRKLLYPAIFMGIKVAAVTIVAYCTGLFTASGYRVGLGYYSMNLNAVINPISINMDSVYEWSRFLKARPQILGNYDGFNYLGLGVLILLTISLLDFLYKGNIEQKIRSFSSKYAGLLLVSVCLAVFAVSNVVTLDDKIIFGIPLPQSINNVLSIFRASSRMFYVPYYLIFLWVTVTVYRLHLATSTKTVLLTVMVAIQIFDISPALVQKRDYFRRYENQIVRLEHSWMKSEFWNEIKGKYKHIVYLDVDKFDYDMPAYAGKNHMTINIPFLNRGKNDSRIEYINQILSEIKRGVIRRDTIYMINNKILYQELMNHFSDDCLVASVDGQIVIAPRYEGMRTVYSDNFVPLHPDNDNRE